MKWLSWWSFVLDQIWIARVISNFLVACKALGRHLAQTSRLYHSSSPTPLLLLFGRWLFSPPTLLFFFLRLLEAVWHELGCSRICTLEALSHNTRSRWIDYLFHFPSTISCPQSLVVPPEPRNNFDMRESPMRCAQNLPFGPFCGLSISISRLLENNAEIFRILLPAVVGCMFMFERGGKDLSWLGQKTFRRRPISPIVSLAWLTPLKMMRIYGT